MNDSPRFLVGVLGTAAGFSLAHAATLAAFAASAATAVFMALSAYEKWQAIKAKRAADSSAP